MIGVRIQKEYAILAVIISYLRVSIKDDLEYLESDEGKNISVKHKKGIKELIALRRKFIKDIFKIIDKGTPVIRRLVDKRTMKAKKVLYNALAINQKIRERKGIETPYVDLDRLPFYILDTDEMKKKEYSHLLEYAKKLANNKYLREGIEEQEVKKSMTFFVKDFINS